MTGDKIKKLLSAIDDIDDRHKGTYTALIDYIKARGTTETPESLFAIMRHFNIDDENSYTHKINAPIPFIMATGLSGKELTRLLNRSVELKKDILRNSGHMLLIDSHRLTAILDLCLSKEPNEKIYPKEINSISKKDKRVIQHGYALNHKEIELIEDGYLQDDTIEPISIEKTPSTKTTNKQEEVIAALALICLQGSYQGKHGKGHYEAAKTLLQYFELELPKYGITQKIISDEKLAEYINNGIERIKD